MEKELLKALHAVADAEDAVDLGSKLHELTRAQPHGVKGVQKALAQAAAKRTADALESELQEQPPSTRRDQDLVRLRSLRMPRSVGTAVIHDHLLPPELRPDGLGLQLTLRRLLGVERRLDFCGLCAKEPGGTLHARFCSDPRVRGHTVFVHNRIRDAVGRLLRAYCRTAVLTESRVPFLAYAAAADGGNVSLRRMDLVVPDAAWADGKLGPAPALMVDASHAEIQCASQLARALEDVGGPCAAAEARKDSCHSGSFDRNCYNLATFAIGSFGVLGAQAQALVCTMAEYWAQHNQSACGPALKALRSIAIARIRAVVSAALHAGLSQRVMAYMAAEGVVGSVGVGGGQREALLGAVADVAAPEWEAAA
jgi:hypothetical protein